MTNITVWLLVMFNGANAQPVNSFVERTDCYNAMALITQKYAKTGELEGAELRCTTINLYFQKKPNT